MASVETVQVVRKDHPDGFVTVNKSDVKKDDIIKGSEKKPSEKKPASKKAE